MMKHRKNIVIILTYLLRHFDNIILVNFGIILSVVTHNVENVKFIAPYVACLNFFSV